MKKTLRSIIIISAFCLQFIFIAFDTQILRSSIYQFLDSSILYNTIINMILAIPMIVAMFIFFPFRRFGEVLGLNKNILIALGVAFVATLPMSVGGLILNGVSAPNSYDRFISLSVVTGFWEEVTFRAFCFGLLFRYARWGFLYATFFSAVLFGIVHLYQANDIFSALAVFGVTALGNVLYAWLYVEWKYNLWIPICMHAFMNAWWSLFCLGQTAEGSLWANVLRILTVLLAIVFTIIYKRYKREDYQVCETTLLINRKADLV